MSLKRQGKWFLGLFITLLGGFLFLVVQDHYLRSSLASSHPESRVFRAVFY